MKDGAIRWLGAVLGVSVAAALAPGAAAQDTIKIGLLATRWAVT